MRKITWLAGVFLLASMAAACTSETLSYADPRIADDGTYPNLNIVPGTAAQPLNEAEANATIRAVEAAKPAVRPLPSTEYEARQLQQLGRTHGRDTLRQIEASGN